MRQKNRLPFALCIWLLSAPWAVAAPDRPFEGPAAQPRPDSPRPMLAQGMMGPGMMWPQRAGRGGMGRGMMGPGMIQPGTWGAAPSQSDYGAPGSASAELAGFVRDNGLACFSCHATSSPLVGPPFNDIAQHYAGQPQAQTQLAQSITNGGSGRWGGPTPMPPGQASPAQARTLATLILKLAK
jgi:cytochrome c